MSSAQVDPHDKMRSRDVAKVGRGEQAPRPVHEPGTVSTPPPPSSLNPNPKEEEGSPAQFSDQMRNCCIRYYEYHRCLHEGGKGSLNCDKFKQQYISLCPYEWIEKWDEERERGTFPTPI